MWLASPLGRWATALAPSASPSVWSWWPGAVQRMLPAESHQTGPIAETPMSWTQPLRVGTRYRRVGLASDGLLPRSWRCWSLRAGTPPSPEQRRMRVLQRGHERAAGRHLIGCASSPGVPRQGVPPAHQGLQQRRGRVAHLDGSARGTSRGPSALLFRHRGESGRPGQVEPRRFTFPVILTSVGSQATGLIVATITLLGTNGAGLASQTLVTNIHGSLVSVYGLFGLAVLLLTILSLVLALVAMARHTLPQNRWLRGLRFLIPGFGVGLVLTFTLSAFRFSHPGRVTGCLCWLSRRSSALPWVPHPGTE